MPMTTNANKFRTLEDVPTITNFEFVNSSINTNATQNVRVTFDKPLNRKKIKINFIF